MSDPDLKEFAYSVGQALSKLDTSIAIRDMEAIEGFRDLDLLRAELHSITCRPELEKFYRVRP
jgi:hypothetical protein